MLVSSKIDRPLTSPADREQSEKVEDIRGDSIDSLFGNLVILFTYPRKNLYW